MLADIIGGWEIVLILSVVLILLGAGKALDLMRGKSVGREAHDAGRSIGGIFGKRATEALTPDNRVAELYNPAAFEKHAEHRRRGLFGLFTKWIRRCALRIIHFVGRSI
jgi:Sec-independent protein translocase protein TatA